MEFKDYYKILGVPPEADAARIKSEYRKKARENHPDLHKGDAAAEARFKEVNEAHEVLGDPDKRRKYDEYLKYRKAYGDRVGPFDPAGPGFGGGPGTAGSGPFNSGPEGFQGFWTGDDGGSYRYYSGGDGSAGGADFSGFSEFFEQLFGGGGGGGRPAGFGFGGDTGGSTASGRGTGVFRGGDLKSALTVRLEELYRGGERAFELNGETIKVKIPPGFPEGGTLKLTGRGQPGVGGGPRGDLLLKVSAEKHARFERRGDDLHCDYPVDLYTMLLGGEESVETLRGRVSLRIPAGSRNGAVLRLKGMGMPVFQKSGKFGDLYVRLAVQLPGELSAEEKAVFEKLARERKSPT